MATNSTAPMQLVVDGTVEQIGEIVAAAAALHREIDRLRGDYLYTLGILRASMIASEKKSIRTADGYEFKFVNGSEFWCDEHMTPPVYCRSQHDDGEEVRVVPVAVEPELRPFPPPVKRRGSSERHAA